MKLVDVRLTFAFTDLAARTADNVAAQLARYAADGLDAELTRIEHAEERQIDTPDPTCEFGPAQTVDSEAAIASPSGWMPPVSVPVVLSDTFEEWQDRANEALDQMEDEADPAIELLRRCLPMLVRFGDFVGNLDVDHDRPGSLGRRCDLIGDIKTLIGGQ